MNKAILRFKVYKNLPHIYTPTFQDLQAESFCKGNGIEVDFVHHNDHYRVWVTMPDGRDIVREKKYNDKNDEKYAVYETYRAITQKMYERTQKKS